MASAALDVLVEERLSERAQVMGVLLRDLLQPLVDDPASPVEEIRGRGLMNARQPRVAFFLESQSERVGSLVRARSTTRALTHASPQAIVVRPVGDKTAWDLCILLARAGLPPVSNDRRTFRWVLRME